MILTKFHLSGAPNRYTITFDSAEGEGPFAIKAYKAIKSILERPSFILAISDSIPDNTEFGLFVDYHENAKITSQITSSLSPEFYLSQDILVEKIAKGKRYPVLHLSAADMLTGDKRVVHNIRYYNVMDSSIWNYYYSFQELFSESYSNYPHLVYLIKEIVQNQIAQLYNLYIATEYADLSARLTINNYSDPIGHGSYVSPHLFHSEWRMLKEYQSIIDISVISDRKWRFLLLDDCAMNSLKTLSDVNREEYQANDGDELIITSKMAILKNAIERIDKDFTVSWRYFINGESFKSSYYGNVDIWCVTNIKDAINLLKHYKFDIVFLDYLLSARSLNESDFYQDGNQANEDIKREYNQYKNSSDKEYGYQLLKRIKRLQKKDSDDYRGPLGRQYFMFISAFTTAVDERLRAEGLNRSESFWHIAEGACPTNTPNLFRYYLLKLMKKRIVDSCIESVSEEDVSISPSGIYDIVNRIFYQGNGSSSEVKTRAIRYYRDVLKLLYYLNRMMKDAEFPQKEKDVFNVHGSVLFSNELIQYPNREGLLEHLVHLVSLVAYGTARQWPEMWEEYLFFKTEFDEKVYKDKEKLENLYSDIEEYILSQKGF